MSAESTPLVASETAPSAGRRRNVQRASACLIAATLVATVGFRSARRGGGALAVLGVGGGTAEPEPTETPRLGLTVSNSRERDMGRTIGDGLYPWEMLAEIFQPTSLEPSSSCAGQLVCEYTWSVPTVGVETMTADSIEVTFQKIGNHPVILLRSVSTIGHAMSSFVDKMTTYIMVKYVRREIRAQTDDQRDAFIAATKTLYTISQRDGVKMYGSKYRSIEYLVAKHLAGAASKECDHWHDGAGVLMHHGAFTLEFEQSIQSIDPHVTVPYWDYSADAYFLGTDKVQLSAMFSDDMFGALSPTGDSHVLDSGPWAYASVNHLTEDLRDEFGSAITNPYGLLRSPWNTNPTPYLTRYRKILGVENGGFILPTCQDFISAFDHESLGYLFSQLYGLLHGPLHVMIGGHWNDNLKTMNVSELVHKAGIPAAASYFLLSSKFLWRQGFLRCPEFCAADTPEEDCSCACPPELIESVNENDDMMSGIERVLEITGMKWLNKGWLQDDILQDAGVGSADVFKAFCHVGYAGEMFTSAAPYDPTFWPMHGLTDKFLTLKRVAKHRGAAILNEAWGYDHETTMPSDTHIVCDWSGVEDHGQDEAFLPTCSEAVCPGQGENDLLPFWNFTGKGETYTNREFYNFTSPYNDELPYVYETLMHWEGCAAQNLSFNINLTIGEHSETYSDDKIFSMDPKTPPDASTGNPDEMDGSAEVAPPLFAGLVRLLFRR